VTKSLITVRQEWLRYRSVAAAEKRVRAGVTTAQAVIHLRVTDELSRSILILWYYPWGTKRIPYADIRSAQCVELAHSAAAGGGNPVRPFITPDDVWAVENILLERAQLASIPHLDVGPVI
jgi:hypothetical protein